MITTRPFFLLAVLTLTSGPALAFEPFVDPLPIPQKLIPKNGKLRITMDQFQTKIHRDLPPIQVWGYNGSSPGPTIEVEQGQKLTVEWLNRLPAKHLFPKPTDSMDHANMPDVRAVVHLHGAVVTQNSTKDKLHDNDGWPDLWLKSGEKQIAEYPNQQSARTLWYHDHAMGETGRNVAAGLEGTYLIHDPLERSLNLPSGEYDIPLMIQPRGLKADGSLYYSSVLAQEYYGNSFFVNGELYPYLEVEPRKYRFRIINGANARFLALKLVSREDLETAGPGFYQIASDSGFLEKTVLLNDPSDANAPRLQLGPAERADIIVDFSQFAGKELVLHTNAKPDDADAQIPLYQVMLFKVGAKVKTPDTSSIPTNLRPIARIPESSASQTRQIVLGEMKMGDSSMLVLNGKMWEDAVSEFPKLGSTEIWEIVNTLPDAHPFHIHLVEFQVLDRRPFDVAEYTKSGKINYLGTAQAPDANEMGWKDVVRTPAGQITRIIMKFAPYAGHYVYHCHILEHEDMDMMRPFDIVK